MATVRQLSLSLVFFTYFLLVVNAESKRTGYVVANLTKPTLECVALESDVCPEDIKILKEIAHDLKNIPSSINSTLADLRGNNIINETCSDSILKLTCLAIPRCKPDEQYVDTEAVVKQCEHGRTVCSDLARKTLLNCTTHKKNSEAATKKLPTVECKKIVDKSETCTDLKYKFPIYEGFDYQETFNQFKQALESIKPEVSTDCYSTLRTTGCLIMQKVCSNDEKKILALITKEECEEKLKCVPEAVRKSKMSDTCTDLPDKNAEKVEISDDSAVPAFSQTISFVFMLFLFSIGFM